MRARWHLRVNSLVLLWLLAATVVAVAHRGIPEARWVMAHLLLLGAVSTAILIWSAHFAEAVRRRPLPGGHRGQALRLALHTAGAVAVVTGLLTGAWGVVVGGAVAVGAGAVWHATALVVQGRGALGVRLGWTAWYFVVAALALPVGVVLGVLLARPDIAGDTAARTYVAHVGVMLLGWVGLTVVGTTVTLWPTMLRTQLDGDAHRAARHGLAVLGAGLSVMLAGAATGSLVLTSAGVGTYLLGLLRTSWPLLAEARRRPPAAFAPRSVGAAWLWLLLCVATWTVLLATAPGWPEAQVRLGGLLAPLAVGFAAQVLLGALTHLGPMILGGGPSAVRAAIAVVERGGTARLVLVNLGLALFLLPAPSLVRVGSSLLVLGALVTTPVLLVRAAVVSRRSAAAPQTGPVALPAAQLLTAPPRRPMGPTLVAAAALALVVAGGAAADPASLGHGTSAAAAADPTGRVVVVEVEAQDMRFEPSRVEVAAGDELVLVVTNVDTTVHDLVLDSGAASGRVAPGATTRFEAGVVGRDLAGWCSVAGHRQMGMTFDVVVTGADGADGGALAEGAQVGPSGDDAHGHDGSSIRSAAQDMDLREAPGPTFVTRDAVLPPAPATTVHQVTLEVVEVEREVAPGVTQTLWTFGGTAPGPALRGRVGDTFEITLVNDGSLGHSIDFHAGALAPQEPMRTIEPGQTLTYVFTATRSGIWMYHCSTMPMSLHIANGMAGAVVIDPPDLPPVDREYLVVQSELYLGEQGGIADAAKVGAERPDAVVFNGHAVQYRHDPLPARVGERIRLWVLDVGPNRPSAFHVVGGQFDTVYLEGAWTLGGPGSDPGGTGGAQVLGLHPAQGGFVELVLPEAGSYPFVSHLMVDAERGALGLISVTD
ncbi:multicopper oxidase domain-containing protein [Actinotalea sp. K2]|uniref:multicopper oxidase domain-containing protein n=1 Tax=Actinotalea sp. K2 TaxID=2939438 RepID=UPI002017CD50|nr:multicopper oxidase domain-containing protein [Actinotalea sp. K2]MCL3862783.1 multicopper oxidase domain-containing protein [Actinotalea sp. K2]